MAESRSSISVRDLINIPFVSKGRDPRTGLDCLGLLQLAMRRFGVEVQEYDADALDSGRVAGLIALEKSKWVPVERPEPGCLVLLDMDPDLPGTPQHLGVVINKREFLHTLQKTGSIITSLKHPFFKNKIRGFYKWPFA